MAHMAICTIFGITFAVAGGAVSAAFASIEILCATRRAKGEGFGANFANFTGHAIVAFHAVPSPPFAILTGGLAGAAVVGVVFGRQRAALSCSGLHRRDVRARLRARLLGNRELAEAF